MREKLRYLFAGVFREEKNIRIFFFCYMYSKSKASALQTDQFSGKG